MSNWRRTLRRLGHVAMFSATRSFGTAVGSAVIAGLVLWMQRH